MFDTVIVPVDGSAESARALRPASAVAHYLDVDMLVVAFHDPRDDGFQLHETVNHQVSECGDCRRKVAIAPMSEPVVSMLGAMLDDHPNSLVVMSTKGHGRSAAVLGSVANDILGEARGPVLLVGPHCEPGRFRLHGPMLVPIDGDDFSEPTVALAEAFVEAFDFTPVVVQVVDPADAAAAARSRSGFQGGDLPPETAVVHQHAQRFGPRTDYTVLHSKHPGDAISAHATESHAAVIVMTTHARKGLDRLRSGSVTADVVGHAPCPVLAASPSHEE